MWIDVYGRPTRVFGGRQQRFFDADDGKNAGGGGGGGNADPPTGDKKDDPPAGKVMTQAELDALVEDRLRRDRETRGPELEKEIRDRLEQERREAELKDQEQYKPLYEQAQAKIAELEGQLAEAKKVEQERDQYRATIEDGLKKRREGLPKHITELLDAYDPIKQAEWLDNHAEELEQPVKKGTPPIPRGDNRRDVDDAEKEKARKADERFAKAAF